jgi:hypothetical protein
VRARLLPLPLLAAAVAPLLLSGCAGAPAPASAVTVTVTPSASTVRPGDSAPYDLGAVCAVQSSIRTALVWRRQQLEAGRIGAAEGRGVLHAVAAQYLLLAGAGPAGTKADTAALAAEAGTLEHPRFDPDAPKVRQATAHLTRTCAEHGFTVGVLAQGG